MESRQTILAGEEGLRLAELLRHGQRLAVVTERQLDRGELIRITPSGGDQPGETRQDDPGHLTGAAFRSILGRVAARVYHGLRHLTENHVGTPV